MGELITNLNSFDDLIKYNAGLVDLIGDCPNIEAPVNFEPVFWRTIETDGGYECQQHILTGKCRVVSPILRRVANGSKKVMLEKMHRLTDVDFVRPGDVIGVSRMGLYEHYAIYIGCDRVIHYCGEGSDFGGTVSVHEADISEFLKGSDRYFVVWFDDGIPYKIQSTASFIFGGSLDYYKSGFAQKKRKVFSDEETVKRARSRLGETKYSLTNNNCEHFAMWCKTGESESSQVKNIQNAAVAAGICGTNLSEATKWITTAREEAQKLIRIDGGDQ